MTQGAPNVSSGRITMGQPIAYHITFTTYGTRFHGDERGTVDDAHNRHGEPFRPTDQTLQRHRARLLKHAPFLINAPMRRVIRETVEEVQDYRGWRLHALNVRTNHVHVVVSFGEARPDKVMGDIKAYATRNLRTESLIDTESKVWTAGGSKRPMFDEDGLARVVDYVENEQGPDLPEE
jgi:REP element-mobilizing transposase RayT